MVDSVRETSVPSPLSLGGWGDFAKEETDTLVKLLRDGVKWGHEAGLGSKDTVDLSQLGKGLTGAGDFLSICDMPGTAKSLVDNASDAVNKSEGRLGKCVDVIENGCDLVVLGCDVVTSVDTLGGVALGELGATFSQVGASLTLPSFFKKSVESFQEIYRGFTLDTESLSEEEKTVETFKFYKAWGDLAFKVSILALSAFTVLPLFMTGLVISSNMFLLASTLGLVGKTAAFFLGKQAENRPPATGLIGRVSLPV